MEETMSFGVWLRRCRGALGLTQRTLAANLGYAFSTYRKLEAAERRPSVTFLDQLASYLGVPAKERALLVTFGLTGTCDHPQTLLQQILTRPQQQLLEHPWKRVIALPHPPTRLIGRDTTLDELVAMLRQPAYRLITLVGPPGVGKTHLALHAAMTLADSAVDFPDGISFVSLAALSHPDLVLPTIAHALGLGADWSAQPDPAEAHQRLRLLLGTFLRDQRLLLLLDNLEQVLEAGPLLAELLDTCPGLTILATSQAPLNLRAEQQFSVVPLAHPNLAQMPDRTELAQVPSVALFVERAQAIQRNFQLTDANSAPIARLCVRLDGLPLAIELAAAQVKLFSPATLLENIGDRLSLLSAGPRDLPPRQQSMRTTIARSYQLLTDAQQTLFARLSVFAGGATFAAITAICTDGSSSLDTARTIIDLIDRSLLSCTTSAQRVSMLETIHAYAREQLITRGEYEWMQERHAAYYSQWAAMLATESGGVARTSVLEQLESEHDNLCAALRWCLAHQPLEDSGASLASALDELQLELGAAL